MTTSARDLVILSAPSPPPGEPRFIATIPNDRAIPRGYSPILGGRARIKPEDAPGILAALNATAAEPVPRWAAVLLDWYRRKWASDRIKSGQKRKKGG